MMKTLSKPLLFLTAFVAGSLTARETFEYLNPISSGIDPHGLRDCQVFQHEGAWYMTGTSWPHWTRQESFGHLNPGVPLYSSDDLTLFQDDDGSVWAFWNRGREFGIGFARIDPIWFDENGNVQADGPTFTPQKVAIP